MKPCLAKRAFQLFLDLIIFFRTMALYASNFIFSAFSSYFFDYKLWKYIQKYFCSWFYFRQNKCAPLSKLSHGKFPTLKLGEITWNALKGISDELLTSQMSHPHCNTSMTFGKGGQNDMKKQKNFILRYWV